MANKKAVKAKSAAAKRKSATSARRTKKKSSAKPKKATSATAKRISGSKATSTKKTSAKAKKAKTVQPEKQEVIFEYLKSPQFRTVHSDGVIGGVTPAGNLHIAFFNERTPIPRLTVQARGPDGKLGNPIPDRTVARPGIIREMDVDVVLSPTAVDALIPWLLEKKMAIEMRRQMIAKAADEKLLVTEKKEKKKSKKAKRK